MEENKKVEVENVSVEKKFDAGALGSSIAKYTAFVVIFFGFLFFLSKITILISKPKI